MSKQRGTTEMVKNRYVMYIMVWAEKRTVAFNRVDLRYANTHELRGLRYPPGRTYRGVRPEVMQALEGVIHHMSLVDETIDSVLIAIEPGDAQMICTKPSYRKGGRGHE